MSIYLIRYKEATWMAGIPSSLGGYAEAGLILEIGGESSPRLSLLTRNIGSDPITKPLASGERVEQVLIDLGADIHSLLMKVRERPHP